MLFFSFLYLTLTVGALFGLHFYMFQLFKLINNEPDKYGGVKILSGLFCLETLLIIVTFGFLVWGFMICEGIKSNVHQTPAPITKTIQLTPQQRII